MAYSTNSKMGKLEARCADSAARVATARRRAGELANRLKTCEDAWSLATVETCEPSTFADLSAERELLTRSLSRARQDLDAAERAHRTVKGEYEQAGRSLMQSQDRLAVAERRGDEKTMRQMTAAIAAWTE